MKKHKRTGRIISVDFKDVESRTLLPADDYAVKVVDVTEEEGDEYDYFNFKLGITEGDYKKSTLWHICSLSPKSLWNLRATLEALGIEVPDSKIDVGLDELKGLEMGVTVEIEKYKGKNKNKVTDVFALEEDDGEEKEPGEEKEEETEESEESDLDDLSLKELIAYAKENKIKLSDKAKTSKSRALKVINAATEE